MRNKKVQWEKLCNLRWLSLLSFHCCKEHQANKEINKGSQSREHLEETTAQTMVSYCFLFFTLPEDKTIRVSLFYIFVELASLKERQFT